MTSSAVEIRKVDDLIARLESAGSIWILYGGEDIPVSEADGERLSDNERAELITALKARASMARALNDCP